MSGEGSYLLTFLFFIFFFKQKTAYELRISDWSSDVCSSDLRVAPTRSRSTPAVAIHGLMKRRWKWFASAGVSLPRNRVIRRCLPGSRFQSRLNSRSIRQKHGRNTGSRLRPFSRADRRRRQDDSDHHAAREIGRAHV